MPDSHRPGAGITWARVEDGFHVGSRRGTFIGYIDQQADGRFLAFDAYSRGAGAFERLTDAMRVLTQRADAEPELAVTSDSNVITLRQI